MSVRDVHCPRCDGAGGWPDEVHLHDGGDLYTVRRWRPCSLCNGTGRASLLDPLGNGVPVWAERPVRPPF